jgi:tetratricopeptide (TPR) repeat protein
MMNVDVTDCSTVDSPLRGKHVAFVGKLGGMTKREAHGLVRRNQGIPVEQDHPRVDLVVIGADAWPLGADDLLDEDLRQATADGRLDVMSETQLWEQLGLVERQSQVRQLYTPAMLADLLHVPVATIRRWHRRGLILPARMVHRLPYFSFQEVVTARRIAQLLASGASPTSIEAKLARLAQTAADVQRPLAQLSVIVEGRDLLLRDGEGLVELNGQRRFDFQDRDREPTPCGGLDSRIDREVALRMEARPTGTFERSAVGDDLSLDELLRRAAECEDQGQLDFAVDLYRTALFVAGPSAEINFQLAELLYRMGDVTASRERYYAVLELDEDYVEARANLGCVLAETGQLDLAVAAFEGALDRHRDYPDVHYHLARTFDQLGRHEAALDHWRHFLALTPDSPWAEEARDRLGL